MSVAVMRTVILPTSPFRGVPDSTPVAALKLNQAGSGAPLASVALRVSTSPTSTSAKVVAGTVKLKPVSSVAACATNATATVGASLTLVTVTANTSEALVPAASVMVTSTFTMPTSAFNGVPLKVCVPALKLNHAGSALPSAKVAV